MSTAGGRGEVRGAEQKMTERKTTRKKTKRKTNPAPHIIASTAISPHSKAVYETGKAILIDSVTASREFCKSMIGISASAIPLYLGILSYLLPKDYVLGVTAGVTITIPAVGFLVATVIFVIGYAPIIKYYHFSLDIIDEIEGVREQIIIRHNRFVVTGLVIFMLSTLFAIIAVIINIGAR